MRELNELLGSRTRVRERYALLPLEGIPFSRLPEWPVARVQVLTAPALGAGFAEYRIDLDAGSAGNHAADGEIEHFLYLVKGEAELTLAVTRRGGGGQEPAKKLAAGSYALLPPSAGYRFEARSDSIVLLLRKRYERLAELPEYDPLIASEQQVSGEVYMGNESALLQSLIPDELSYDLAMNIFTFQSGHGLPVTETHVMEHGLYVLQGKGVYFLDDRWMEVEASDFIWMGPFCPQSYYATGPQPTRYLYYKNVNREIPL